jgi:periplasmic protein TonB
MATVLNSYSNYAQTAHGDASIAHLRKTLGALDDSIHKSGIEQSYLGKWYVSLSILVILLHVLAFVAYQRIDRTPAPKAEKREILVEIYRPEPPPPEPIIEPPKPIEPPPPPEVVKPAPSVPKPAPVLKTEAAVENIQSDDIVVAENTEAPKSTSPVVSSAAQAPEKAEGVGETAPAAAPPVEEPVTEATANAAYLNNPKPNYPSVALKQGWGGTVLLKVRVLASGAAESVQVKKSSGKKVLDEAALSAVKSWTFVPSKRGSTAIDGWATVPVIFNPEQ